MPSFGNEVGTDVEIATEKNISPDNNKIASTKPKLQHKDKNRSVKPIVLSPAPIPVDMCDQIPNKLEQNQAKKLDMAMQPPSTQSATQSIVVPSETNTIKPKRSHIKQNIQASKIQAELPIIDVRNVDTIESTDTVQTKIVKDKAIERITSPTKQLSVPSRQVEMIDSTSANQNLYEEKTDEFETKSKVDKSRAMKSKSGKMYTAIQQQEILDYQAIKANEDAKKENAKASCDKKTESSQIVNVITVPQEDQLFHNQIDEVLATKEAQNAIVKRSNILEPNIRNVVESEENVEPKECSITFPVDSASRNTEALVANLQTNAETVVENVKKINQQDLPVGYAKKSKNIAQGTTVEEMATIDVIGKNVPLIESEKIAERPKIIQEEANASNIHVPTIPTENLENLVPMQSRRASEKASKSREPSMTRIDEKTVSLDDAPVNLKDQGEKQTARKSSEILMDPTYQEQMVLTSSTKHLNTDQSTTKAQISPKIPNSPNVQEATIPVENIAVVNPNQSRRSLERASKSREPSMTRIDEKVMFVDNAQVNSKKQLEIEKAGITSEQFLDPTVQEQMISTLSTQPLVHDKPTAKAELLTETNLPLAPEEACYETLETVMPHFEKQSKVKFEDEEEKHEVIRNIESLKSQIKEFVEPCGNLTGNVPLFEVDKTKASRSRDNSVSRSQEAVVPMEFLKTHDQAKEDEEKATRTRSLKPSQSQVEEFTDPCGNLGTNIALTKMKKKKANRSRDSSVSRIQEATIPMEYTIIHEKGKEEGEKATQNVEPLQSQVEEVVEPYGTLNQKIEHNDPKKTKAVRSSVSQVQESIVPTESLNTYEKTEKNLDKNQVTKDIEPSQSQLEEVVMPFGTLTSSQSDLGAAKQRKATKSRESSVSRVQEAIVPVEVTGVKETREDVAKAHPAQDSESLQISTQEINTSTSKPDHFRGRKKLKTRRPKKDYSEGNTSGINQTTIPVETIKSHTTNEEQSVTASRSREQSIARSGEEVTSVFDSKPILDQDTVVKCKASSSRETSLNRVVQGVKTKMDSIKAFVSDKLGGTKIQPVQHIDQNLNTNVDGQKQSVISLGSTQSTPVQEKAQCHDLQLEDSTHLRSNVKPKLEPTKPIEIGLTHNQEESAKLEPESFSTPATAIQRSESSKNRLNENLNIQVPDLIEKSTSMSKPENPPTRATRSREPSFIRTGEMVTSSDTQALLTTMENKKEMQPTHSIETLGKTTLITEDISKGEFPKPISKTVMKDARLSDVTDLPPLETVFNQAFDTLSFVSNYSKDNSERQKAQLLSETNLPIAPEQMSCETLETVRPNFEKKRKVKFEDEQEKHEPTAQKVHKEKELIQNTSKIHQTTVPIEVASQKVKLSEELPKGKAVRSRKSSSTRESEMVTASDGTEKLRSHTDENQTKASVEMSDQQQATSIIDNVWKGEHTKPVPEAKTQLASQSNTGEKSVIEMQSVPPVISTSKITKQTSLNTESLPLLDHAGANLQEAPQNEEKVFVEHVKKNKRTRRTASVHMPSADQGLVAVEEPNTLSLAQNIAQPRTEVPNVTSLTYPEHEVHQQEKIESLTQLKVCKQVPFTAWTFFTNFSILGSFMNIIFIFG